MRVAKIRHSDYELFGMILQSLRNEEGLSQKQLAEKLGMPQQTYQGYESGSRQVTLTLLKTFANYFDVSIDYLAGRTSDRKTHTTKALLQEFDDKYCKDEKLATSTIETIAAHRTDDPTSELPQEARKSIDDFKKFIYDKHGIKYD
jgi:transcriptional regulator with XRE-family HTH domain